MKISKKIVKIGLLLMIVIVTIASVTMIVSATNNTKMSKLHTQNECANEWLESLEYQIKNNFDHDFDFELLTVEEGYEIVIDRAWIYNKSNHTYNGYTAVMKHSVLDSTDSVSNRTPDCCGNPKVTGAHDIVYYHNSAPHPTICISRDYFNWRCSNCGSYGTRITDYPQNCPSPNWWPTK